MNESELIQTLFAEYQHLLNLNWLVKQPIQNSLLTTSSYWLGEFGPDAYHPVEIIHRDNLELLNHTLQQGHFYSQQHRLIPSVIIFSDNCFTQEIATLLQPFPIAVLQSPLSAKVISHELAHAYAERLPNQNQHGVMLSIDGHGILLTGRSGIGKSALALDLISRGHQLVADDSPLLYRMPNTKRIIAVCPPLLTECLEVRGLGILNLVKLFGNKSTLPYAKIDLVIELVDSLTLDEDIRLQVYNKHTNILGVDLPHLSLPVSYPASLAVIVETATRNHVLYQQGDNAANALIKKQHNELSRQTV